MRLDNDTVRQLKYSSALFLTAFIWGNAFVVQVLGMDFMGPLTFTWARSLAGGLFLLLLIPLVERLAGAPRPAASHWKNPSLWVGGVAMGLCLYAATVLQQVGLMTVPVGKAGFLTALYIVFVPLFAVFSGRRVAAHILAAGAICLAGVWLLCMGGESLSLREGDLLVLACAAVFALHILVIDRFVRKADALRMSALQFFVGGTLGLAVAAAFEEIELEALLAGAACILYAGCLSNGVAYTLQVIGQKGVHPALASLIMSLESAISALAGWFWLGQALTAREVLGCVVMGLAIVLAQLPPGVFARKPGTARLRNPFSRPRR